MSNNWFVQHPEVMEFIMKHEAEKATQEPIVIECDEIIHTEGHPFCSDPTCSCREDVDNLSLLVNLIKMGLLTTEEASQVMQGATI
jgi:hypothetical protein